MIKSTRIFGNSLWIPPIYRRCYTTNSTKDKRNRTLFDLIASPIPHTIKTLRGSALIEYLKPLQKHGLNQLQKDALVGGLLGDGSLQYNGGQLPYYKFDQKAASKEYVDLIYSIFDEYVGTPPKPRMKTGKIQSYWFRTFRINEFDFYAKQFYTIDPLGNRKSVVPKLIHRWLNPQSLAFWFMDNGSRAETGYKLNTHGYLRPDVIRLQKALGRVFRLQSNIHLDNRNLSTGGVIMYSLYIPASHATQFHNIVEPYMLNFIKYKLYDSKVLTTLPVKE